MSYELEFDILVLARYNACMKACIVCKKSQTLDSFAWKNKSLQIKQSRCKLCMSEASKKSYRENKDYKKAQANANRPKLLERNRVFVWEYLSTHPCVDCGNSDPRVLEFDHVQGEKVADVSTMIWQTLSIQTIANEISKCEVRCANCHRIVTAARGNWWRAGVDPIDQDC